jgi:AraC-like DNA-binding protein
VADPHRRCGVAQPARNGLGRLAADFLRSVRKEIDTVGVPFGENLGRTIVDLTGLLLDATDDDSVTCEAAPYSVMHRRCLAYIEANLCDPKLSPEIIARAMGISVRHLHRVFSGAGDSVCESLSKRRLERCRGDLLDYRKRHLSIAEIAFRNGFIGAGHFAESFKAEFGVTARSMRKAM